MASSILGYMGTFANFTIIGFQMWKIAYEGLGISDIITLMMKMGYVRNIC